MAWTVEPPWDWALVIGALVLLGVFAFGTSWSAYQGSYSPAKAAWPALFRAVRWLLLFGGSFALLFWLFSLILLPGWLRYAVGGGIWWLLAKVLLPVAWEMQDDRFG